MFKPTSFFSLCGHEYTLKTESLLVFHSSSKSSSLPRLLMQCQAEFLLTRTGWKEIDLLGKGVSQQLCLENVAPVH